MNEKLSLKQAFRESHSIKTYRQNICFARGRLNNSSLNCTNCSSAAVSRLSPMKSAPASRAPFGLSPNIWKQISMTSPISPTPPSASEVSSILLPSNCIWMAATLNGNCWKNSNRPSKKMPTISTKPRCSSSMRCN